MNRPEFGQWVENRLASESNPTRRGMFVRAGNTPHGRMNPGPWWEITDGRGEFWRTRPENCDVLDVYFTSNTQDIRYFAAKETR